MLSIRLGSFASSAEILTCFVSFYSCPPSSFLFDRLDQTGQSTNGSSSTSSSDTDSDDDRNGRPSSQRHGLDRLKSHHYRSYGNSSSNHHGSKSPPSRSSSVAGSAQHSANSSIGSSQIMDPSQAPSPANGKRAIKKRRKDPLAPKRPSNAFFIFSQQHRQQAREEKKEGNQSELTKFLGQQWKSMPSTEKKVLLSLLFFPHDVEICIVALLPSSSPMDRTHSSGCSLVLIRWIIMAKQACTLEQPFLLVFIPPNLLLCYVSIQIYSELAIQDRQRYLDEMSTYQTEGFSKSVSIHVHEQLYFLSLEISPQSHQTHKCPC